MMRVIFFLFILMSSIAINAQTLADFYKKERIGAGIGLAYYTINNNNKPDKIINGTFWPSIVLDVRYQKPSPRGIHFQYKHTLLYDLLPILLVYQNFDDGNAGSTNIGSGFFGRLSIGRNFSYNIEKGTAFSAGFVLGDSYLALGNFIFNKADGFHMTPGIFINYDRVFNPSYKIKLYIEAAKAIPGFEFWLLEAEGYKYPFITSFIAEVNHLKGIYATAEIHTAFNIRGNLPAFFDPVNQPPHPIRFNLGAGYRFNL